MKRPIAAVTVATLLALAACVEDAAPQSRAGPLYSFDGSASLWVDPDTRCEYLVFKQGYGVGVVPRSTPDGTQICGRP